MNGGDDLKFPDAGSTVFRIFQRLSYQIIECFNCAFRCLSYFGISVTVNAHFRKLALLYKGI